MSLFLLKTPCLPGSKRTTANDAGNVEKSYSLLKKSMDQALTQTSASTTAVATPSLQIACKLSMTAGAGKTTTLLKKIQELQEQGIPLQSIYAMSFSKATVEELKARLRPMLPGLSERDFIAQTKNITTQHSVCYRATKGALTLMGKDDYALFAKESGFQIVKVAKEDIDSLYETVTTGKDSTDDELMFAAMQRSRLELRDPADYYPYAGEKQIIARMKASYLEYMEKNGKLDFIGMIEHAVDAKYIPYDMRALLVDEAQDMCPLLYEYHKILIEAANKTKAPVFWYGDEDQCIYEFMGADPQIFVNQPAAETIFGEHSYRMPNSLALLANKLIARNRKRLPKQIKGSDKLGFVKLAEDIGEAATMMRQAVELYNLRTVLWLCPINFQADQVKAMLTSLGYPVRLDEGAENAIKLFKLWKSRPQRLTLAEVIILTTGSLNRKDAETGKFTGKKLLPFRITYWEGPRKCGEKIKAWAYGEAEFPRDGITPEELGLNETTCKALASGDITGLNIDHEDTDYIQELLNRPPSTYEVEVITIHKSKGREADVVVNNTSIVGKMKKTPTETLRRLAFVAMTRTKMVNIYYQDPDTDSYHEYI